MTDIIRCVVLELFQFQETKHDKIQELNERDCTLSAKSNFSGTADATIESCRLSPTRIRNTLVH